MKFFKDNLAICIVGIIAFIAVCFATCGNKPYIADSKSPAAAVDVDSCKNMVGAYDLFLKAQASQAIALTKNSNPKILSIDTAIEIVNCVSKTVAKIKVSTLAKIQVVEEDGTSQILCGKASALATLEQQESSVEVVAWSGDEQMTMVPCE